MQARGYFPGQNVTVLDHWQGNRWERLRQGMASVMLFRIGRLWPWRKVRLYVGTFKIIYPPNNAKIKSGDHAARNGGS